MLEKNNLPFEIISKLSGRGVKFAIIGGKYEKDGLHFQQKKDGLVGDLDIVFFNTDFEKLKNELQAIGIKHIEYQTYLFIKNEVHLPIDIYIDYINTGYYYLFKIDAKGLKNIDGVPYVSERDYILYQLIEPLIKFSEYKPRHIYRLQKYYENGYFTLEIKHALARIVGPFFAKYILTTVEKKSSIDKRIIKLIKLRLLLINGNFKRMIKERILQNR